MSTTTRHVPIARRCTGRLTFEQICEKLTPVWKARAARGLSPITKNDEEQLLAAGAAAGAEATAAESLVKLRKAATAATAATTTLRKAASIFTAEQRRTLGLPPSQETLVNGARQLLSRLSPVDRAKLELGLLRSDLDAVSGELKRAAEKLRDRIAAGAGAGRSR